ncbi:MAG: hypothetical protein U1E05_14290 [Patescibacteria group bacterium]|nr:hypothetical protein [Patescibacteria group bacterium]
MTNLGNLSARPCFIRISFGQRIVRRECILRKMADAENEHRIRSDREYGPMSNMPTKAIVEFADFHREVVVFARQRATLVVVP